MKIGFLLLLISIQLSAQSTFEVFSRGNFQGLKDTLGNTTIEPIYDELGWSDGSWIVKSNLIGYKDHNKWGLISASGRRITNPHFDKLEPFGANQFLVATKEKFTNRYFYGIIDERGKTVLNQDYFEISKTGDFIILTLFENEQFRMGGFDLQLEALSGVVYSNMRVAGEILIATYPSGRHHLLNHEGVTLGDSIDAVREDGEFVVITKNGFDGLVSKRGQVIHEPIYKEIKSHAEVMTFPTWEIQNDGQFQLINCDSLTYLNDDLWLAHLSSTVIFYSNKRTVKSGQFRFIQAVNGYSVLKVLPQNTWVVVDNFGEEVLQTTDSIHFDGKFIHSFSRRGWSVFNKMGERISSKFYEKTRPMNDRFIAVKKFGYWAILDGISKEESEFRYDDIAQIVGTMAILKYVGEWGVMQVGNDWLIQPNYDSISYGQDHFLAEIGRSHFLFTSSGIRLFQTIDYIVPKEEYFQLEYNGKYSVLKSNGRPIANTEYREVTKWNDFYELRNDFTVVKDSDGRKLWDESAEITDVLGLSDDWFLIKKNQHFGFVDRLGNLRIANRYDSAMVFSEGLAAVKLRDNWGFVNKEERLVIQPHYSCVTSFKNGVSVFESDGLFGFLSADGKEISKAKYSNIWITPEGNYILSIGDKFGYASSGGGVRLSPIYEQIEEMNGKYLIGQLNGKKGVMDLEGHQITKFKFADISMEKDYLLLRRSN